MSLKFREAYSRRDGLGAGLERVLLGNGEVCRDLPCSTLFLICYLSLAKPEHRLCFTSAVCFTCEYHTLAPRSHLLERSPLS